MHNIEIILGLLLAVTFLAVVAQKLAIPYPILLVLGKTLVEQNYPDGSVLFNYESPPSGNALVGSVN